MGKNTPLRSSLSDSCNGMVRLRPCRALARQELLTPMIATKYSVHRPRTAHAHASLALLAAKGEEAFGDVLREDLVRREDDALAGHRAAEARCPHEGPSTLGQSEQR